MNRNQNSMSVTDGLLKDNTVFSAGMIISPIIICADTLKSSVSLIYAFTLITLFTDLIAYFIPKKFPYTIRVTLSAFIGSMVYIPIKMLTLEIYPKVISDIGIYFPLLAVNSLIVYQMQNRFHGMKFGKFTANLIFYILGFDAAAIITGIAREYIAYGTINNQVLRTELLAEGISLPFGGFIVLGVLCGIYRKMRSAFEPSGK